MSGLVSDFLGGGGSAGLRAAMGRATIVGAGIAVPFVVPLSAGPSGCLLATGLVLVSFSFALLLLRATAVGIVDLLGFEDFSKPILVVGAIFDDLLADLWAVAVLLLTEGLLVAVPLVGDFARGAELLDFAFAGFAELFGFIFAAGFAGFTFFEATATGDFLVFEGFGLVAEREGLFGLGTPLAFPFLFAAATRTGFCFVFFLSEGTLGSPWQRCESQWGRYLIQ